MQKLVYYVASTLDGYIAKSDHSVPGFAFEGPHADAYVAKLATYSTIVMGRGTYEFGYTFGMKPGEKPYGDRTHYIFSHKLSLPVTDNLNLVRDDFAEAIDNIKATSPGEIYLAGGGKLAAYFLEQRKIDSLIIKLSPIIYGNGIKLFDGFDGLRDMRLDDVTRYDNGVLLLEYALQV